MNRYRGLQSSGPIYSVYLDAVQASVKQRRGGFSRWASKDCEEVRRLGWKEGT